MRLQPTAAALAALLASGCSVGLTAHLPEVTLQVTPGTQGAELAVIGEQQLSPQSTSSARSIQVEGVTLTALGSGTFDFLFDIHLWVSAPGLPDMEVASLATVPLGATQITLEGTPDTDLLPYLAGGCTLRLEVTGVVPAQDFSYDGDLYASVGI